MPRGLLLAGLSALCLAILGLAETAAAAPVVDAQAAAPAYAEPAYERLALPVAPGREGLILRARLSADSAPTRDTVHWRISAPTLGSGGEDPITAADADQAGFFLKPGDYRIEITYGESRLARMVTLASGEQLQLTFDLNTGGLSVAATIGGEAPPAGVTSTESIYAADGPARGQLVASGAKADSIIYLPAGRYRIESRIAGGNVAAQADVNVSPGRLSRVRISHAAGLVRLTPVAGEVWRVRDASGKPVAETGGDGRLVLTPGRYSAELVTPKNLARSTDFTVTAGQSLDILASP